MEIKKYQELINEEFIGSIIKGSLSNLFKSFSAPFKDLSTDIKNMFKENNPNSIKEIIISNFTQAIENAKKEIPKISDEAALTDLFPKIINSLTSLANGLDKDVITALGNQKAKPA